jgi:hypothetical protein
LPAKSLQLSWSHVWLLVLTGWPQRRHIAQDGAEVNAQDMEGNTPFDWADDYGHGECAVLLWRRGAQIKTQTGKRTYISLGRLRFMTAHVFRLCRDHAMATAVGRS